MMQKEKISLSDENNCEELSFEDLFKAHYSKLIFFANKFVNDIDTAEELVSETFAVLWEHKEKYSFKEMYTSFLYKMVQNRCLNHIKHKKIENTYVNYLQKNNLLEEASHFQEDQILAREFELHIQKAIAQLPERCREVFNLSRFEHKKNKEIARILQISHKTVERQMTIALEKLRFKLHHLLFLAFCWMAIFQ